MLLALIALAGCNNVIPTPAVKEYPQGYFNNVVISAIALTQTEPMPIDTVVPEPNPTGKHARADCPTGGWITHGDGHKSRCPDCDPPYTAQEELQDLREQMEELRKQVSMRKRATLPDVGIAPAPVLAVMPKSNVEPKPIDVLLANSAMPEDTMLLAKIEAQVAAIQNDVKEIKTLVEKPAYAQSSYGQTPTAPAPVYSNGGSAGSAATFQSSPIYSGGCNGSSYGYNSGYYVAPVIQQVSYAPAPVQRMTRNVAVPQRPGHWTYPGTINGHLESTHGVNTAGMSREQMLDLHDALHEGTASASAFRSGGYVRASYGNSNCPGGVCPTGNSSYSRSYSRGGGLLGFGWFGRR